MRKDRSIRNEMEPLFMDGTDGMEGWDYFRPDLSGTCATDSSARMGGGLETEVEVDLDAISMGAALPEDENCADDRVPEKAEAGISGSDQAVRAESEQEKGDRDSGKDLKKQTGASSPRENAEWSGLTEDRPKNLLLPDVISMTKYFCDNYKKHMYAYLNQCMSDGSLQRIVGFPFQHTWLNSKTCQFTDFSYWKIDRESFYTDVHVRLMLKTGHGSKTWDGTIEIWCKFCDEEEEENVEEGSPESSCGAKEPVDFGDLPEDDFLYMIEKLVPGHTGRQGLVRLSPFLVPYYRNMDVDKLTEELWDRYMPEALYDYRKRNAFELAKRMGLRVVILPLENRDKIASILFFRDDELEVRKQLKPQVCRPVSVRIPARTIVINEKLKQHQYPQFDIYHECIHYEEHYLFYRLQGLRCNDTERMRTIEVPVEDPAEKAAGTGTAAAESSEQRKNENNSGAVKTDSKSTSDKGAEKGVKKKGWTDPVYFMEKQANRGAIGLMMPAGPTHEMINRWCAWARCTVQDRRSRPYRHMGELYEDVGIQLSCQLGVPHFRMRARMIQLGYIEARGSLNYANRTLIEPFAFDTDAWREMTHTFIVDRNTLQKMMMKNPELRMIIDQGEYVYADGHVVRNGARYVRQDMTREESAFGERPLVLTDWANSHVDECCLRFVRVFVQRGLGRYEFGRMYYDAEYIARTKFYINDFLNREKLGDVDDIEARMLYRQRFPKNFEDAFQYLRVSNGISMKDMADKLGMNPITLKRWLESPVRYRNEDFLTAVCLVLKLPDWISRLLFKRASVSLDEDDRRHMALDYILRAQSCDGIKAANEYLNRHDFKILTF